MKEVMFICWNIEKWKEIEKVVEQVDKLIFDCFVDVYMEFMVDFVFV